MLILARKTGQSIVLGVEIEITVVEVRGDQVRLGITAPRSVQVYRKELLDQLQPQNGRAGAAPEDTRIQPDELTEPESRLGNPDKG